MMSNVVGKNTFSTADIINIHPAGRAALQFVRAQRPVGKVRSVDVPHQVRAGRTVLTLLRSPAGPECCRVSMKLRPMARIPAAPGKHPTLSRHQRRQRRVPEPGTPSQQGPSGG